MLTALVVGPGYEVAVPWAYKASAGPLVGRAGWILMWLAEAVSQMVSAHRSAALGPRESSGCCLAVHLAGGSGQILELVPALWWVELGLGFCGDRAGSVVGRGNQGTRWSLSACCWVKLCPCSYLLAGGSLGL